MKYIAFLITTLLLSLSTISCAQMYQFTTGHGDIQQLRVGNLSIMQALEENNVKDIMAALAEDSPTKEKDIKFAAQLISKTYKGHAESVSGIMNPNATKQAWYRRTYFAKENNTLTPLYHVRVLFKKGDSKEVASIEFISAADVQENLDAAKKANEDLVNYQDYLLQ